MKSLIPGVAATILPIRDIPIVFDHCTRDVYNFINA
jgi:hypothetical protein